MQQLELQFQGYADERRPDDVNLDATKQRLTESLAKAKPVIILYLQATSAVALGFSFMFLAAIIGG